MIFDRIDIFVVCIVFGCCLTIAEAFIGMPVEGLFFCL